MKNSNPNKQQKRTSDEALNESDNTGISRKIEIFLIRIQLKLVKVLWKLQSWPPFRRFSAYKNYFEYLYNYYDIELKKRVLKK